MCWLHSYYSQQQKKAGTRLQQAVDMLWVFEEVTFPPRDWRHPAGFCFAPSAAGCDCKTPQVSVHLCRKQKTIQLMEMIWDWMSPFTNTLLKPWFHYSSYKKVEWHAVLTNSAPFSTCSLFPPVLKKKKKKHATNAVLKNKV